MTKKFKIIWSPTAKLDLINIYSYIFDKFKEPHIANDIIHKILESTSNLSYYPERYIKIFSYTKKKNLRRLCINNYIIIYDVNILSNEVFILHIFHSTQDYLSKL